MLLMSQLYEAIIRASANRSRMVFLSKTQAECSDISKNDQLNMNSVLSELLIVVPKEDRARGVTQLVANIINSVSSDVVLITGLEILFDRTLAVDPIRLLATCAKNKTLLVAWPGDKTSSGLSYATPSHPEHRTYKASDLSDVIVLTNDAQLN